MYSFNGKDYPCCSTLTMGIIGGKWKVAILYYLMNETLRYNELRKKIPTITERTLSIQLKSLSQDGIIRRKVYYSKPPLKVEYSLTEFGKTLIPLIELIADWGSYASESRPK